MGSYIDITNHTYGRLFVKERFDKHKWVCICSCGKEIKVFKENLRSGHTKSCGCIEKDHNYGICDDGLRSHPLYQVWKTMIYRCCNPKRKEYKNYGGRGIKVCDRWLTLSLFIEDMYNTYVVGLELDRSNNDGNYELDNCKWVTEAMNKQKTRRTKLNYDKAAIIRNSDKTAFELANIFNCSRDAIYDVLQNKTWIN